MTNGFCSFSFHDLHRVSCPSFCSFPLIEGLAQAARRVETSEGQVLSTEHGNKDIDNGNIFIFALPSRVLS